MRQRLAEIGHAPPDDETADRPGDTGKPNSGDQCTDEEGFGEEGHACSPPVTLARDTLPSLPRWEGE